MSSTRSSSSTSKKKEPIQTTMGDFLSKSKTEKKTSMKKKRSILDDDNGLGSKYFSRYRTKDVETYRDGYPGKKDDKNANDNWQFYSNKIKSYPNGDFIDEIHKSWWGDYKLLERHHGYIQWIFPIRESGMNYYSQELQMHEIEKIKNDKAASDRVLKSYRMMLDFYGMEMRDQKKGYISRAENWKQRFAHLNRSYHNYLRITRMLKSLGELGYEHLKKPFVEFVLQEAMEEETLDNVLESCVQYWLETLRSDEERESIKNYVRKMEAGYGTRTGPVSKGAEGNDFSMTDDADVEEMVEKSKTNLQDFDRSSNARPPISVDEDSHEAEMFDEADDPELAKQDEEILKETFYKDNQELRSADDSDGKTDIQTDAQTEEMEVDKDKKTDSDCVQDRLENKDKVKNLNQV
ncbi:hypothetical protein FSP39_021458 [Pinctada imbricata]|uniref:Opioid growth factor receptor (OGFr) conserved domain-containing protein n=1 Tax=Pinctada imbricata TaxID=66713 RepID=A0AA88YQP9_PINIB|nr:hypothetical protein FSP39_021458 [Pinctada imbricata]